MELSIMKIERLQERAKLLEEKIDSLEDELNETGYELNEIYSELVSVRIQNERLTRSRRFLYGRRISNSVD